MKKVFEWIRKTWLISISLKNKQFAHMNVKPCRIKTDYKNWHIRKVGPKTSNISWDQSRETGNSSYRWELRPGIQDPEP